MFSRRSVVVRLPLWRLLWWWLASRARSLARRAGPPLGAALVMAGGACDPGVVEPGVTPDGAADVAPDLAQAEVALGRRSVLLRGCAGCHDPGDGSLSGLDEPLAGRPGAYPPNLTPDPDTGLGDWSDAQIARAIRAGVDDEGQALCPVMPRYPGIDDGEVRSIVAYLRALPPVMHAVPPTVCQAAAPDAAVPADAAVAAPDAALADLAPASDLLPVADLAVARDAPACSARVNEVQTAGLLVADAQVVELYNPCAQPLDLDGSKLVYRASAGVADVSLAKLDGLRLAAHGYLVLASAAWLGVPDVVLKSRLAVHGGGLALRDPFGVAVDSVGWGDAQNAFVRGQPAAAPAAGQAIARIPDGKDSGSNHADFTLTAPTPGRRNQ